MQSGNCTAAKNVKIGGFLLQTLRSRYFLLRTMTRAAAPSPARIPINGAGDAGVLVAIGFTVGTSGVGVAVRVGTGVGIGVGVAVSQMLVPWDDDDLDDGTAQMSLSPEMLPKREVPSAVILFAPETSPIAIPN